MSLVLRGGRVIDQAGERLADVEVGAVAIISVLDEDGLGIEGQAIDEAIAADLLDRRIHHDRVGEAVSARDAQRLPDEFLPAAIDSREVPDPARVDDVARG